jgi:hypothetical protein
VQAMLAELPELQLEAGWYLQPSRGGDGRSLERSIGVNINALDFAVASDLLTILHDWERVIRRDRQLTPPAMVGKEPTIEAEVTATCQFHIAHLDWSLGQDWALQFAGDVLELHAKGRSAARKFKEQARKIPCPTDDCNRFVVIDVEQFTRDVSCIGCKQTWSVLRLVALAVNNPNKRFFLDVEAIALWLQTNERDIYRLIKKHAIERRGGTYDLAAIIKARNNVQSA